jgi:hypothetical protein
MALDEKNRQRFVDVPAVVSLHEGSPVIASNIDASRRFMGITTSKRSGIWVMPIAAGSITDRAFGYLYFGLSRRHAFSFSYVDRTDGKRRQAVITADDPATVDRAVALLGTTPAAFKATA